MGAGTAKEGCYGTWNLDLVIDLEAMEDSRGRSAASPEGIYFRGSHCSFFRQGESNLLRQGGSADSIGKEGSAVLSGLKNTVSLESAHLPPFLFSRTHFFLIIALILV